MAARPRKPDDTSVATPSAAASVPRARVLVVLGAEQMVTVPLPARGELVIGRDPDCDVPLVHSKISRRHLKVVVDRDVAIEDLGSTNGIRLGGNKLVPGAPAILPLGESVRMGPFSLVVVAAGEGTRADVRGALTVLDPTEAAASELIARVAQSSVNVILRGETGTGKEVLARTLHHLSKRSGELVGINCAALSGALLESELFGHEKGAFTGATREKPGLLEAAGSGTALLDEIGELPLELQAKLLRAIETRQVYRVGGVQPIAIAARFLAATHRDLEAEIAAGRFRQDLFYRLNGLTLVIPPLRTRRAMIPILAATFRDELAARGQPAFTPAAIAAIAAHDWPGNVRELRQTVERAILLAGDGPIDAEHVLLSQPHPGGAASSGELASFLVLVERHAGNASAIARELRTSRTQVARLAERHGIDLAARRRTRE